MDDTIEGMKISDKTLVVLSWTEHKLGQPLDGVRWVGLKIEAEYAYDFV